MEGRLAVGRLAALWVLPLARRGAVFRCSGVPPGNDTPLLWYSRSLGEAGGYHNVCIVPHGTMEHSTYRPLLCSLEALGPNGLLDSRGCCRRAVFGRNPAATAAQQRGLGRPHNRRWVAGLPGRTALGQDYVSVSSPRPAPARSGSRRAGAVRTRGSAPHPAEGRAPRNPMRGSPVAGHKAPPRKSHERGIRRLPRGAAERADPGVLPGEGPGVLVAHGSAGWLGGLGRTS